MIHIAHKNETEKARQVQSKAGHAYPTALVGWCGAREESTAYFKDVDTAAITALTEDRTLKLHGVCPACLYAVLTALIALPVAPEPKP